MRPPWPSARRSGCAARLPTVCGTAPAQQMAQTGRAVMEERLIPVLLTDLEQPGCVVPE
jgi:hypothetical protein